MSPRPKKAQARAIYKSARAEGRPVAEAAKLAGVARSSANRWESESVSASLNASRPSTASSSPSSSPVSSKAPSTRPEIPPRAPDLDAARKAAGLPPASALNGTAPEPGAPPPVTPEQVLDLAEGCVALGGSITAGLSGAPAEDPRVVALMKLSARERGILQPMAPSVARRMPEILEKLDRFMPYAFAATLLVVTTSHCRAINQVGKEASAAKKAAKKAAEEAKAREAATGTTT